MEPLDISLIPPPPECYKKGHSFVSLSSAAKLLSCNEEDLVEQMKIGKREKFAQAIMTDTDKYPDGREHLYESPVFRLTKAQLKSILAKGGDTIDLDPELNGWMLGPCPPRRVPVEVGDLMVAMPNCDLCGSGNNNDIGGMMANTSFDLEEHWRLMLTEAIEAGKPLENIVVEMKEKHNAQYSWIARNLFDYPDSSAKSTWRKRGERAFKKS